MEDTETPAAPVTPEVPAEQAEEAKSEEPAIAKPKIDPNSPDSPLWDEDRKLWLDRRTGEPLRDQDPGIPHSDYVGKHNLHDEEDYSDGIKKKPLA